MKPALTLYGRPGCHLCEAMAAEVQPHLSAHGLSLRQVDIDVDPALTQRYGLKVPVLCGPQGEICHYFFDEAAFRAWLAQELA